MTIEKTMERAIRKVIKRGYTPVDEYKVIDINVRLQNNLGSYVNFHLKKGDGKPQGIMTGLNDLLFDHRFARALWGDLDHEWAGEKLHEACNLCKTRKADVGRPSHCFKAHLLQMAFLSSIEGRVRYIGSTM